MTSLPETTTDRLLAVADIIELAPDRYDQNTWVAVAGRDNIPEVDEVCGRAPEASCGTRACIAGWAVMLTPTEQLVAICKCGCGQTLNPLWEQAGAIALGLHPSVAVPLFSQNFEMPTPEIADLLRRLAKLDENQRHWQGIYDVLLPEQIDALDV